MSYTPTPVRLDKPDLLLHAVSDGKRLGLQLHHVLGMNRSLARSGAWWHVGRRMWVTSRTDLAGNAAWLRQTFERQFVSLEGIEAVLRSALDAPQPDYFTQLLDVQIFPLSRGNLQRGRTAVSFTYDALCVSAMRQLRGYFHGPAAAWQVDASREHILSVLRSTAGVASEFVFVHERSVVLEDLVAPAATELSINVPAAKPEFADKGGQGVSPVPDEGSGYLSADLDESRQFAVNPDLLRAAVQQGGLRNYQVTGVRHLASQSGACLGDDMGLGKSRQTVVAARLIAGEGRVLIVCPASLRINWEREIHMIYPKARVGMVGEDRMATLYSCEWVVANYARLGGLVREPELHFSVMAIDEAHYLKEHKSGRTRNAFMLAARIPRRYVITGTPLLNREIELHTLLRLTGHALGRMTIKDFRRQYSGTNEKRAELAAALQGWLLRRRKNVLTDLGNKSRQIRWISPPEGLAAYQAIYDDPGLQAMPKITKLRQCLETLKVPFLIETVESLSEGDKIIIFCEYTATIQLMEEALADADIGCVSLVGSDSARKRQQAIDAFQNDPGVTVFIGTTGAAGVGITLTAGNYVAFASLPWTPAEMRQAEDRAYRLGQKRDVLVLVPLIANTIDESVGRMLESKQQVEEDVIEAVPPRLSQPADLSQPTTT